MSDQALELIKKCLETQDPYLDLGNCGLTGIDFVKGSDFNKALNDCTHLKTLILSNEWSDSETGGLTKSQNEGKRNHINYIAKSFFKIEGLTSFICRGDSDNRWGISDISFVSNLSNLTFLNLGFNKIQSLKGIGNLTSLQVLDLNINQVNSLNGIENLTALTKLFLSSNQIQSLNSLQNLADLQMLDIAANQIEHLTGIGNLTFLQILDAGFNKIQSLNGLENLIALKYLWANDNQIQLLNGIEKLNAIQILAIDNNKIDNIKLLIPFLKNRDFPLNIVFRNNRDIKIGEINLKGNPLIIPPLEIASQGSEAVLNYFAEIEERGVEYLYEAKMLIVGQPRAGKTSLRYKLFDTSAELPKEEDTTRGIDIKRLDFNITDKEGQPRKFYYNVWDFGGQQIYQTTHQFFLTHRSLYILVIDTGKDSIGNDDATLNYWLQALELLGGNSPLLLVRNEKNERQVYIDFHQKQARFNFLRGDYNLNFNALIPGTPAFDNNQLHKFSILKEDIETELRRLPLVGFPMPKNWVQIRDELQALSKSKHYITLQEYLDICTRYEVADYERQMELSRIFHDLGVFLHFQDYDTLEEFIILQNTWATDAVFAVFDSAKVQAGKGKFSEADLPLIWKDKQYAPNVHKKLLALMMQFELCYQVGQAKPHAYIIPEMLSDSPPGGYKWQSNNDLPVQYKYDFMPRGILTRLIVRMNKQIALYDNQQVVWKTGVKIDGTSLDCLNTTAEISEAWNNKQLDIRVQGPSAKDLMSKITFLADELNNEFFRQVNKNDLEQRSRWYKMIPCNCVTCKDQAEKNFYDYRELLEMKEFIPTIRCKKKPYAEVSISSLIDGVFVNEKENSSPYRKPIIGGKQTITIFLASSSELREERNRFEIAIGRENKLLNEKGFFLKLQIWEDFLDAMSKTRLQDEYNKAIQGCDIFVMLYFTKVGKYTAEEFENAFKQFKENNKPQIYTYFKSADLKSSDINRTDVISLLDFEDKLKELGHFSTVFENSDALWSHFKIQLEKIYDF